MDVVFLVLSALAGAGVSIHRRRADGPAERVALGGAGCSRSALPKAARGASAHPSPIAAIQDPVTAAAAWARLRLTPEAWEARYPALRSLLLDVAGAPATAAAMIYADRLAGRAIDRRRDEDALRVRLEAWLTPAELAALDEAVGGRA